MSPDDLCYLSLAELATLIEGQEVSIEEVVGAVLGRIARENPSLNCFITVLQDQATSSARERQAELRRSEARGPLHGVPVSVKDNLMTAGIRTTVGSPTLSDWVPDRDADVVDALRRGGAVLVGKTNLQQFAYGAAHPDFGEPRNPHNLELTCGGSSSGSAAAVAAGLGYGSVGTDTGGSIRIPAAFCGVVALKPTYGLVSRSGAYPVSNNLDHVGPMARTVTDCALMLAAIADPPPNDKEPHYLDEVERGVKGIRFATMRPQPRSLISPEVESAFESVCDGLEREGAIRHEVVLPDLSQAQLIMWIVSGVEAAEWHRKDFRERRDDYNSTMKTRLESAEFISATDYVRAQRVRQRFREDVDALFQHADAILLPTVGVVPYRRGTARLVVAGHEEDVPNVGSRLTALANVTGHPSIAVPCHRPDSLPISFQVITASWQEAMMFRVARAYERLHQPQPRPAAVSGSSVGS
jgi:aspartyl-tRNA(Asn)/glutamyl-tRNA(Gln) amidotransferase subunit A